MKHLVIVTPVYNDWNSLALLIPHLRKVLTGTGYRLQMLVAVHDPADHLPDERLRPFSDVLHRLPLRMHLGRDRALATGLAWVDAHATGFDAVITLDMGIANAVQQIPALLMRAASQDTLVLAEAEMSRLRGVSGWAQRLYQAVTGYAWEASAVAFIPAAHLPALLRQPALWQQFAAGVREAARTGIPFGVLRYPALRSARPPVPVHKLSALLAGLSLHGDRFLPPAIRLSIGALFLQLCYASALGAWRWMSGVPLETGLVTGLHVIQLCMITSFTGTVLVLLLQANPRSHHDTPVTAFFETCIALPEASALMHVRSRNPLLHTHLHIVPPA